VPLPAGNGPTLAHAIQALHGSQILLPTRTDLEPAPDLLEVRYQRFRQTPTIEYQ
jgi:hypothetical protein